MESNGIKRRIMSNYSYDGAHHNNQYQVNSSRMSVDRSTNTDNQIMTITSWTQTEIMDIKAQEQKNLDCLNANIDQLTERIRKLESMIYSQDNFYSNAPQNYDLNSKINNNHLRKPIQQSAPQQSKYKIISEGVEVNIEPVDVVYTNEECITLEQDLNTSNDSERLEICLPKECNEGEDKFQTKSKVTVQQNHQHTFQGRQFKEAIGQQIYTVSGTPSAQPTISMGVQQQQHWHFVQQPQQSQQLTSLDTRKNNQQTVSPIQEKIINQNESSQTSFNQNHLQKSTDSNRILNPLPSTSGSTHEDLPNPYISIGPNNTRIPTHIYQTMDWSSTTAATRKLLTTIFDRETLATHSMTGKPSPAFKGRIDKPAKLQLQPEVVADIVYSVSRKCNVPEKDVKNAITTKCADENKMFKQRENKRKSLAELNNKENKINNIQPERRAT